MDGARVNSSGWRRRVEAGMEWEENRDSISRRADGGDIRILGRRDIRSERGMVEREGISRRMVDKWVGQAVRR